MRPSLMLLSRHAARPEACARLCSRPAPRPRTNAAVVLQNWWSKRRAAPLPPTQPRPRCTVKNLGMPLAAWPGGCGPRACIPKLIQTRAPCGRSHHLHRRAPGQAGSACRRGSPGWPGDGQQLPVAAAASCRLCRRPPSCASARLPQKKNSRQWAALRQQLLAPLPAAGCRVGQQRVRVREPRVAERPPRRQQRVQRRRQLPLVDGGAAVRRRGRRAARQRPPVRAAGDRCAFCHIQGCHAGLAIDVPSGY